MTWSARASETPGVWLLCRDGVDVGTISLLQEAGWRTEMLVEDAVHGLNNPLTIDERGFGGKAADLLERRRAKIRGEAGR